MKPQVAVQRTTDATVLEENYRRTPTVLGHQLVDLLKAATVPVAEVVVAALLLMVMLAAEAAAAGAPHTGLAGEPVAEAIAEAEATQIATSLVPHAAATTPAAELKKYDEVLHGGENDGFPALSARLCNLLLLEKFKPLGITKYDAKQDPVQWLRCYALSIKNPGGNNDTKCLYFPFCLDQAQLTWLESPTRRSSTSSKTVSTIVAHSKTSVAAARAPSPSSRT
jgi:hypothetical protein